MKPRSDTPYARLWPPVASLALALGVIVGAAPASATPPDVADVADVADVTVERGVALGLFASHADWDYGPLLDEIRDLGATHVLIAVVWTQKTMSSARIHRQPGTSPHDATVVRTLRQARARGLVATLFPIVRLEEHRPDEWRGRIAPAAGVDAWFASYRDFMLTMADLARAGQAARVSVGSELVSLERNDRAWRALIRDVRARFPGRILYSANWDHFVEVPFWDAVDDVGVTAYFELARDESAPGPAALATAWQAPRAALAKLRQRTGKPLIITEVGYPSLVGAARYPWDETRRAPVDLATQAALYDAFCAAFREHAVIDGFYVWNWFGFGGPRDTSYTPRGKPAAAALSACLRSAWSAWHP